MKREKATFEGGRSAGFLAAFTGASSEGQSSEGGGPSSSRVQRPAANAGEQGKLSVSTGGPGLTAGAFSRATQTPRDGLQSWSRQ